MRGNAHVRFGGAGWGNGLAETPTPRPSPTLQGRPAGGRLRRPSSAGSAARWLLFCVRFVGDRLSWQTPGALSPDLEDLL